MKQDIIVDHVGDHFESYLKGDLRVKGSGKSVNEAIGSLIIHNQERLDMKVVVGVASTSPK
jgi:hypothetical protein